MTTENVIRACLASSVVIAVLTTTHLYLRICKVFPWLVRGYSMQGIAKAVGFNPKPYVTVLEGRPGRRRRRIRFFEPCCDFLRPCGRKTHDHVTTLQGPALLLLNVFIASFLLHVLICATILLIRAF